MSFLKRILPALTLTIARLFLVAWIGGAALFVITSIAEQQTPQFDSMIKDQLATIRFPLYYLFGSICLGTSIVATGLALLIGSRTYRTQLVFTFCMCILSASVAGYDYVEVYLPLQKSITPPGQVRSMEFRDLHEKSRLINEIHISLAALAAIVLCVPPGIVTESRFGRISQPEVAA